MSLPEGGLAKSSVETPAVDVPASAPVVSADVPEAVLGESPSDKKKGVTERFKSMFSRKSKTEVEAPSAALDAGTPIVTAPDVITPEAAAPSVESAVAGVGVPSAVADIDAPSAEGVPAVDVADLKTAGEFLLDFVYWLSASVRVVSTRFLCNVYALDGVQVSRLWR
jgi:hypothetical protein